MSSLTSEELDLTKQNGRIQSQDLSSNLCHLGSEVWDWTFKHEDVSKNGRPPESDFDLLNHIYLANPKIPKESVMARWWGNNL